jgi:hypothetical protein
MLKTERFQMHCRRCFQRFEAATVLEALEKVTKHEMQCAEKPTPEKPAKGLQE